MLRGETGSVQKCRRVSLTVSARSGRIDGLIREFPGINRLTRGKRLSFAALAFFSESFFLAIRRVLKFPPILLAPGRGEMKLEKYLEWQQEAETSSRVSANASRCQDSKVSATELRPEDQTRVKGLPGDPKEFGRLEKRRDDGLREAGRLINTLRTSTR